MERSDKVGIITKYNTISRLDVMVTESCNLSCTYCFHKQRPLHTTDRLMEDMVAFLGPYFTKDVTFNLFGGEPMLCPEFCMKWVDRLRELFPTCGFMMSTNGTIFNKALMCKLLERNTILQISHDGLDQERQRTSAALVEKNIRMYRDILGKDKLLVRMTLDRVSLHNLSRSVEFIHEELGINRIYHSPALNRSWTPDDIAAYGRQLDEVLQYQVGHPNLVLETCDTRKLGTSKPMVTCGAGSRMVAVDANGYIYPCHRIVSRPEARLGSVSARVIARGKFLRMQLKCGGCVAEGFCPACPVLAYENNGSYCEPFKPMCDIARCEFDAVRRALPVDDITGIKTVYSMIDVLNDVHHNNDLILRKLDAAHTSQPT